MTQLPSAAALVLAVRYDQSLQIARELKSNLAYAIAGRIKESLARELGSLAGALLDDLAPDPGDGSPEPVYQDEHGMSGVWYASFGIEYTELTGAELRVLRALAAGSPAISYAPEMERLCLELCALELDHAGFQSSVVLSRRGIQFTKLVGWDQPPRYQSPDDCNKEGYQHR